MEIQLTFGEELALRRKRAEMSQAELGEKVGLHHWVISMFEKDKSLPTPEYEKAIRDILGWEAE